MRRLLDLRISAYGRIRARRKLVLLLALAAMPATAEQVTVTALGDSLTAGYGLPQGAGVVPQLETWLRDKGADVAIRNAGVSGDTTAGGLARVDWTLADDPDALILALGGNDVLRGIPPEVARANLAGILERVAAREIPVLLVGIDVPGNYGSDYEAAFEAIYPGLAERFGIPLYPDFFGAIRATGRLDEARATYLLPDGLHPNARGVRLVVADFGPYVLDLVERARQSK